MNKMAKWLDDVVLDLVVLIVTRFVTILNGSKAAQLLKKCMPEKPQKLIFIYRFGRRNRLILIPSNIPIS